MAAPDSAHLKDHLLNKQVLLLTVALLLPGLVPTLFGWLSGLLATLVFCLLCINGQKKGTLLIRNSALIAAAAALFLKLFPTLFLSLAMMPLGFSFNKSYVTGENEIRTGARGAVFLAFSWLIFWVLYGMFKEINPYNHLLNLIDLQFAQSIEHYRMNADFPAETMLRLEKTVNELRRIIPVILPGLLCCSVLITVWINLLLSSSVIARIKPGQSPWRKYSHWRLPDKLIWLFIFAGIILLSGQEQLGQVGIALFLATTLLYFFQGLAVFIYMLEKWKVPAYLRIIIYIILVIQSYGLILLILAGLADVWFNFRQPKPTKT